MAARSKTLPTLHTLSPFPTPIINMGTTEMTKMVNRAKAETTMTCFSVQLRLLPLVMGCEVRSH